LLRRMPSWQSSIPFNVDCWEVVVIVTSTPDEPHLYLPKW